MKINRNLVKEYKTGWNRVEAFEENESRGLSMKQKFYQLASLINMATGLGLDFSEDRCNLKARSNWLFLKKVVR